MVMGEVMVSSWVEAAALVVGVAAMAAIEASAPLTSDASSRKNFSSVEKPRFRFLSA